MMNFIKNLFGKTKQTVQQTLEHASGDIKEVVDSVTEDAGKMMAGAKEQFTEHVGEPSELMEKARKALAETKEDASKMMAGAKEKLAEVSKEVKEEFTEHVGEPSELIERAKKTITETADKIKATAKEEWAHATEKVEELKESMSDKGKKVAEEPVGKGQEAPSDQPTEAPENDENKAA